jgi:hypothetical protein
VTAFDDETKRLLDDVAHTAANVGGGRILKARRQHLEALALFDRCRSTFGAVRLLAESGFGQEAVGLARSIFTESLMLMELADSDERRQVELVVGWSLATVDDLDGLFVEAEKAGDDVDKPRAGFAALRAELEQFARGHGARTRRWRPNEKALARTHGRDGYFDFRIAHHFVHGSTFAVAERYSQRGDVVFIGGPGARGDWPLPAVLFASESLVHATRAAATILGLEEPPGLDELLERVEEVGRAAGLAD